MVNVTFCFIGYLLVRLAPLVLQCAEDNTFYPRETLIKRSFSNSNALKNTFAEGKSATRLVTSSPSLAKVPTPHLSLPPIARHSPSALKIASKSSIPAYSIITLPLPFLSSI